MAIDERFPPKRAVGQRKGDWVNPDAWLTIKASGPRPPKDGEASQSGKELSSRSQGMGAPLVEFTLTKAERNNLPPQSSNNSLPWDDGMHGGYSYSDDDQRAPGFNHDGSSTRAPQMDADGEYR